MDNMIKLKKYIDSAIDPILEPIKDKLSDTYKLRLFGMTQIPLLFLVKPTVIALNDDCCEVKIPLNRMTKNHVGSMYFGALAIGADCVVGMLAMYKAEKMLPEKKFVPIFKDFKADFLKRAESEVVFSCLEGEKIESMILKSQETRERVTESITAEATTPDMGNEVVARFTMGLSLKFK